MKIPSHTFWLSLAFLAWNAKVLPAQPFPPDSTVQAATRQHLAHYPQATLKDLYKFFFQDRYGPGHLISDTAAASGYLRHELRSVSLPKGPVAEPTGWQHNYYRIDLSVVKKKQVPFSLFFNALIQSTDTMALPMEEWEKEWLRIEAAIAAMNLALPHYQQEKEEIMENLHSGRYEGHHSEIFREAYQPHYRIIRRYLYEREIAPLLRDHP